MEAAGLQNLAWTRVRFPDSAQIVLWCNGLARNATDVVVWVRVLIELHLNYGVVAQLARALDLHSKSRGFESHLLHILPRGVMVAQQILILLVPVRPRPW